jgi:hypothetical protein
MTPQFGFNVSQGMQIDCAFGSFNGYLKNKYASLDFGNQIELIDIEFEMVRALKSTKLRSAKVKIPYRMKSIMFGYLNYSGGIEAVLHVPFEVAIEHVKETEMVFYCVQEFLALADEMSLHIPDFNMERFKSELTMSLTEWQVEYERKFYE